MEHTDLQISTIIAHTKGHLDKGEITEAHEVWRDFLSGVIYHEDWDKVRDYCKECIKLLPEDYIGYYVQGVALSETGDNEQALSYLTKASVLNPEYERIFFTKASVEMDLERYEDADKDCSIMLSLCTTNPGCYNLAAQVKTMLGQYKEAVEMYTHAIELKPGHAYYYIQRAADYGSNGDFDEALQDFATAEKLLENISTDDTNAMHLLNLYFARSQVKRQMGDDAGSQENYAHFDRLITFFSKKDGLSKPASN